MTPTALVTGAASGIGAATLHRLRNEGYRAIGVDIVDRPGLVHADVSRTDDWVAVASLVRDDFGGLDLVHLNAGVASRQTSIVELSDEAYRRTVGVNVDGVVFGVRALVPLMRPNSAIVVTASIAGLRATALDPIYTVTKHAVVGLVRSVATELAGRGIRINALCPSYVDTPLAKENAALTDLLDRMGARWLTPADVADAVLRIAAFDTTGQAFVCMPGRELAAYPFAPIEEPT